VTSSEPAQRLRGVFFAFVVAGSVEIRRVAGSWQVISDGREKEREKEKKRDREKENREKALFRFSVLFFSF